MNQGIGSSADPIISLDLAGRRTETGSITGTIIIRTAPRGGMGTWRLGGFLKDSSEARVRPPYAPGLASCTTVCQGLLRIR